MLKLYKRVDGSLHYHEAWITGEFVYEHWGVVGDRGKTRKHPVPGGAGEEATIAAVLRSAAEAGFEPIELEDHATLLIEYPVIGHGTGADVDKRHAVEERMNETLGWTGLGACDGGSIGSGTMEVCCFVVDFEIARRVISDALRDSELGDFARIYDEAAES